MIAVRIGCLSLAVATNHVLTGFANCELSTFAGIASRPKVDLPETIDLLLLDGAKALYPNILALLENRLRPGAFVVADDADKSPDYLARVRSTAQGYLSTPFGGDIEVSMRLI